MKKSLFALAVLGAFAGAAQAQSSVTLYGTLDAGVGTVSNTGAGNSFTGATTSNVEPSSWGMRGMEDLGGGMKANFNLESGFDNLNGQIGSNTGNYNGSLAGELFARAANVGISGAFGTVTLGRQFNPFVGAEFGGQSNGSDTFLVNSVVAAGATVGNGTTLFFPNNAISYSLPKFANIEITGLYAFGNNNSANSSAGNTTVVTAAWSSNGVSLGGGYQSLTADLAGTYGSVGSGAQVDETDYTLYAKYTAGPFSIGGNFINAKNSTVSINTTMVSAGYQVSPEVNIALGYTNSNSNSKVNLLGTYALSKRTYLYAMVDSVNNSSTSSTSFNNLYVGTPNPGGGPGAGSTTAFAAGLVTHF